MSDIVLVPKQMAYHIWLIVMLTAYEKGIIHGLVAKGYTVSPADFNGSISCTHKAAASTLIALKVEKDKIVCSDLMNDARNVLDEMKALYYGLVISEHTTNCTWLGTNINVSLPEEPETKAVDKKAN